MDDCYWIVLYEGIVSLSYSEYENMYSWYYLGRDMSNGTTAHFGKTYWNGEYWICDDYRDIYNGFEYSNNRINNFDYASYSNYPSAKAVVDYVGKKVAEVGGGDSSITEITLAKSEILYTQTLEAGIYKINSPNGLSRVALGKANTIISGNNNYLYIGGAYTEATASEAGVNYFDKPYMYFYNSTGNLNGTISMGVIRGTKNTDGSWTYDMKSGGGAPLTNKDFIYTVTDTDIANFSKIVCPQALIEYFNSKLVPIDLDVGGEHADNEYYNANVVDAVLIEVVGLVEEMGGYIEQFAVALDDLTARVEALEG